MSILIYSPTHDKIIFFTEILKYKYHPFLFLLSLYKTAHFPLPDRPNINEEQFKQKFPFLNESHSTEQFAVSVMLIWICVRKVPGSNFGQVIEFQGSS
jgi:hypothetical protein